MTHKLFLKKDALLWCFSLLLLLGTGNLWAQCPQPLNILLNPDFENITAPCLPLPNGPSNGAFNRGCVTDWAAANTTPSICGSSPVAPAHGDRYACLGSNTEGIFQTLVICQGEDYRLTFQHRGGSFDVYMAQNLANVGMGDPEAFTIDPLWQLVSNVPANNTNAWTTTTLDFTAQNLVNNQLLFIYHGGGDYFLDDMSMVCVSQLDPQITATNMGGGTFNFDGIVPVQPPFGVVNWCWDFGDGSPTQSGPTLDNVTHTFQQGGTYNVCLTIQDNCCFCLNTICITIRYDPCACGNNPLVLNSNNLVNWTGLTQDINNDVIIAPGTDLVVTSSTLNIRSACKFVVMRGASMNVLGSTLQSACDDRKWGGIVVWGNSGIQHSSPPAGTIFDFNNPVNNSPNAPGVLLSDLNSHISDMNQTGIFAQRLAADPNENIYANLTGVPFDPASQLGGFTGGLVRCASTEFVDNDLSADFRDYPFANYSQFSACQFTTAVAPTELSTNGPEGVRIWNTDNISFLKCDFDHVGARGIVSVNGSLTMAACNMNQHYQGLRVTSASGQTGFVKVGLGSEDTRNRFTDNRFGIYSDGIFNLNVYTNTFSQNGDLVTSGPLAFFEGGGIFASGASSFDIYNNDFNSNVSGAELLNTGGAGAAGLNPSQRFKCNIHQQDRIGMLVRGRCPGMYFIDNEFDNASADLALRRNFFTAGEIHLNQGQSNSAVYNYFSPNATDVSSSTAAGQTVLFNYFPPFTSTQLEQDRATPDCDVAGFQPPAGGICTSLQNYRNQKYSLGYKDGCLADLPRREYEPCTDRTCLDAMNLETQKLQELVSDGSEAYKPALATAKMRFDTDKRNLVSSWFEAGDMKSIEAMLTDYGTTEDLQMLFTYYMRNRDYATAEALLEKLPEPTTDDVAFKAVQKIYLEYARSAGQYVASDEDDQLLLTIAPNATPAGGNARAVYYLLHGIWLEPEIDRSEERNEDVDRVDERGQTISTTNQTAVLGMVLSPNPANELVTVSVQTDQDGSVLLTDLRGAIVSSVRIQAGVAQLATTDLNSGLYLVQHRAADGHLVSVQKLAVQH